MQNTDTAILVFLLSTNGSVCPPAFLIKQSTTELYRKALRNKVAFALAHFLHCPTCRKELSQSFMKELAKHQKNSVVSRLLYEQEKRRLSNFLRKNKLRGLFFKDTKRKLSQQLFLTDDIDLLIDKEGALMLSRWLSDLGYKKTVPLPKEVTYSRNGQINIDIHTMIAYPHSGGLGKQEMRLIQQFSAALLKLTHDCASSLSDLPNKNYQLLSLCIRFIFNDLMTGLGTLYELTQMTGRYKNQRQWHEFLLLAGQYQLKNEVLFLVAMGKKHFQLPIPSIVIGTIPWKIKMLASSIPASQIAEFPPIKQWQLRKHREMKRNFHVNLGILKLLISDRTSLIRLFRPKIVIFFGKVLLINLRQSLGNIFSRKNSLIFYRGF